MRTQLVRAQPQALERRTDLARHDREREHRVPLPEPHAPRREHPVHPAIHERQRNRRADPRRRRRAHGACRERPERRVRTRPLRPQIARIGAEEEGGVQGVANQPWQRGQCGRRDRRRRRRLEQRLGEPAQHVEPARLLRGTRLRSSRLAERALEGRRVARHVVHRARAIERLRGLAGEHDEERALIGVELVANRQVDRQRSDRRPRDDERHARRRPDSQLGRVLREQRPTAPVGGRCDEDGAGRPNGHRERPIGIDRDSRESITELGTVRRRERNDLVPVVPPDPRSGRVEGAAQLGEHDAGDRRLAAAAGEPAGEAQPLRATPFARDESLSRAPLASEQRLVLSTRSALEPVASRSLVLERDALADIDEGEACARLVRGITDREDAGEPVSHVPVPGGGLGRVEGARRLAVEHRSEVVCEGRGQAGQSIEERFTEGGLAGGRQRACGRVHADDAQLPIDDREPDARVVDQIRIEVAASGLRFERTSDVVPRGGQLATIGAAE